MKIGYEAKRIYHNTSGLGNYGRNLLRALAHHYPDNQYLLYNPSAPKVAFGEFSPAIQEQRPALKSALYANLWRQRLVSKQLKADGVDLYHGLAQELPQGLEKHGLSSVVSVHDLIFLRYPKLYKAIDRRIYTHKIKSACKRANRIVAISQQTKQDLIHYLKVPAEKISVIYQGVNPLYWEKPEINGVELRKQLGLPDRFALFVGTLEERKGVDRILDAQSQTGIPVVYIGRKTSFWQKAVAQYTAHEHLIFAPEVKDDTLLAQLYREAEFFVYPSIFEGFGIPVLEALVSGTPVITSNLSSLPEAAGPSSILINPHNTAELAKSMKRLWESNDLKVEMAKKGLDHAQQFSDAHIASQWMELYQSLKA